MQKYKFSNIESALTEINPPEILPASTRVQLFDNRVGKALLETRHGTSLQAVIFFLLPFFVAGMACVVGFQ